jgi:F-type H+-transporting ATPase subunit b
MFKHMSYSLKLTAVVMALAAGLIILPQAAMSKEPANVASKPALSKAVETPAPGLAAEPVKEAEHAQEHHDDAHKDDVVGLPQLDFARFPGQLFWLTITFALTYVLMRFVALPQVQGVLDQREQRISNDVSAAKNKNDQAKRLLAEYETRLTKARGDAVNATKSVNEENAKATSAAIHAQEKTLQSRLIAAEEKLNAEKQKALQALDQETLSVIATLVKAVAGFTPDDAKIKSAFDQAKGA